MAALAPGLWLWSPGSRVLAGGSGHVNMGFGARAVSSGLVREAAHQGWSPRAAATRTGGHAGGELWGGGHQRCRGADTGTGTAKRLQSCWGLCVCASTQLPRTSGICTDRKLGVLSRLSSRGPRAPDTRVFSDGGWVGAARTAQAVTARVTDSVVEQRQLCACVSGRRVATILGSWF